MTARDVRTIATVVPYYPPHVGGTEMYAERVTRAVDAAPGMRALVITTGNRRRTEVGERDGITVIRLGVWYRLSNTPVNPLWPITLRRLLRRYRVAVVHAHAPVPFLADVAVRSAGRRPVVLTYHAGSMAKGVRGVDTVLGWYEKWVLPRTFRRATRLIAVSSTSLAAGLPGVETIGPGVDTEVFVPSGDPAEPVLLYVGRMERTSAWKGVDVLVRAFAAVAATVPYARLRLVGAGSAVDDLRCLAADLGIAERVEFAGVRTGDDLVRAYQEARAVVLPSRTEAESFGMTLVEAMSCGRPVIGSAVGGIPAVVADGVDGFLVPPGDVDALAAAAVTLLNDAALAASMGRSGRRKAVEMYAWRPRMQRYTRLFGDLADVEPASAE